MTIHMGSTIKRRTFLKTAAVTAAALAMPAVVRAQSSVLRMTSWGGPWGEFMKTTLLPRFEAEFKCTTEVDQAVPFLPKLLASSRSNPVYDVYLSNPNEQWVAFERGLLGGQLTEKEVPNIADLFPYARSDKMVGVAAFNSAIGLAYRTDKGHAAPTSWKDFALPAFAGKRGSYLIGFNTLAQSHLLMLGKVYGSGLEDLDAAYAVLAELLPLKTVDFTGQMEQSLINGEVDIAILNDRGVYLHEATNPIAFAAPKEGIVALEHVYNVTPETPVKELAYAFIDFMLRPDVQKEMAQKVFYSPTNMKAELDAEYRARLLTSDEKVANLIQIDWAWYNSRKDEIDARVARIMRG